MNHDSNDKLNNNVKNVGQTHEEVVSPSSLPSSHPQPLKHRTIVVALDESAEAEYAFHWTLENILGQQQQQQQQQSETLDHLILLNVREPVALPPVYGSLYMQEVSLEHDVYEKLEESRKKHSHDLLRGFAAKLPQDRRYHGT